MDAGLSNFDAGFSVLDDFVYLIGEVGEGGKKKKEYLLSGGWRTVGGVQADKKRLVGLPFC